MNLEHIAYNVADPDTMARWYVKHLGLRIVHKASGPNPGYFLADGRGMMVEIYRNPAAPLLDSRSIQPLSLHLALSCDSLPSERARLMAAGAAAEGEITRSGDGTEVAMLRDPWGLVLQLIHRKAPLVP